jgi:hypothetical protein
MKTLVIVDDYHDFELIISAMAGLKMKHLELGSIRVHSIYTKYLGVIYKGKRPSNAEINVMLVKAKIKKIDVGDYVQQ